MKGNVYIENNIYRNEFLLRVEELLRWTFWNDSESPQKTIMWDFFKVLGVQDKKLCVKNICGDVDYELLVITINSSLHFNSY